MSPAGLFLCTFALCIDLIQRSFAQTAPKVANNTLLLSVKERLHLSMRSWIDVTIFASCWLFLLLQTILLLWYTIVLFLISYSKCNFWISSNNLNLEKQDEGIYNKILLYKISLFRTLHSMSVSSNQHRMELCMPVFCWECFEKPIPSVGSSSKYFPHFCKPHGYQSLLIYPTSL